MKPSYLLMLAVAIPGLSGCGAAGPVEGDITFDWTFNGQDCGPAGVATVDVEIDDAAGNTITTDSVPCEAESATYTNYSSGDYHFTLIGLSPGGATLYEADGPITVYEGENTFNVDLTGTST